LHNRNASAPLDHVQPSSSIIERSGQHDADDSRAVGDGCRSEERVNRGAMSVLAWPGDQTDPPWLDEQVRPWGSDIDVAALDGLSIGGMDSW
jgi:hypothetical protein